ncbi:hypothetical protein BJY01DRAFT_254769 [Aspergillus pseudoustus]|uniref:Uncharacterized protein n=1 Tax=Aspergillus pseudoustus TaxID=1810923 RepID=A0ABR4IRA8_9EURO
MQLTTLATTTTTINKKKTSPIHTTTTANMFFPPKHVEAISAKAHVHFTIEANDFTCPSRSAYDLSSIDPKSVRHQYPGDALLLTEHEYDEAITTEAHVHFPAGTREFPARPSRSAYQPYSLGSVSVHREYPGYRIATYQIDGLQYRVTVKPNKKWYKFWDRKKNRIDF